MKLVFDADLVRSGLRGDYGSQLEPKLQIKRKSKNCCLSLPRYGLRRRTKNIEHEGLLHTKIWNEGAQHSQPYSVLQSYIYHSTYHSHHCQFQWRNTLLRAINHTLSLTPAPV